MHECLRGYCSYEWCCCRHLPMFSGMLARFFSKVYTWQLVLVGHKLFSYSVLLCDTSLFSKVISNYIPLQYHMKIHGALNLLAHVREIVSLLKSCRSGRCKMIASWDFYLHFFAYYGDWGFSFVDSAFQFPLLGNVCSFYFLLGG